MWGISFLLHKAIRHIVHTMYGSGFLTKGLALNWENSDANHSNFKHELDLTV